MRNLFNSRIYARFKVAFLLAALAVLAGCTGANIGSSASTTTGTSGVPTFTIGLSTNSIGGGVNATVTATLKDGAGVGISGAVIAFTTPVAFGQLSQASAVTDASGVAIVTLSATIGATGTSTVTASVQSVPSTAPATAGGMTASTGYNTGAAGTTTLLIGLSTTSITTTSSATVTATLKDAAGLGIAGAVITFSTDATYGLLRQTTALTNASGVATTTLSLANNAPSGAAVITGTATFVPVGAQGIGLVAATGYATGGGVATTVSAITISPAPNTTTITADGISSTVITATVTVAAGGNPAGITVAFNKSAGTLSAATANTTQLTATTGVATVTFTSPTTTTPNNATISASSGAFSASTNVKFKAGVPANVAAVLSPTTLTANTTGTTASTSGSTTLTATVTDVNGNPVLTGTTVTFASSAALGAFTPATATTNGLGIVSTSYTAGACAAAQCTETLTVTAGTASGQAFLTVKPANIALALSPTTVAVSGVAAITATVTNATGQPVSGTTVNFSSSSGGSGSSTGAGFGVALATTGSAVTNGLGVAQINYTAGSAGVTCITSCADVLTAAATSSISGAATLTVNKTASVSLASVSVTSGNASMVADGASYTFVRAVVRDTSGAGMPNLVVTFSATAGTWGTLVGTTFTASGAGPYTATTDATGTAQLYLRSPLLIGSASIVAGTGGTSGTVSINFIPGPPAVIGMNLQPSTVLPGGTTNVTVAVVAANGNPVGAGQTIIFSTAASGVLSVTTGVTDANGLIALSYKASNAVGSEVLKATATNGITSTALAGTLTVSTSSAVVGSITVAPAMSSVPAGGGAAGTTTLNATVRDTSGLPITGASVLFAATAGVISGTNPATTNASGIATVSLASGSSVMAATVTATSSGYSATTNVQFTAGVPTAIGLNPAPNTALPGGTSTITAAVVDANGNPVAGNPVTFSFAQKNSGNPSLSATTVITDVSGLARVTYTAGANAGTDIVTAITNNSVTPSIGPPDSRAYIIVASNAAVVGSVVATASQSSIPVSCASCVPATSTMSVKATVRDTAGLPLANQAVTFTTTSGSITGSASTDINGIATATLTSGASLLTATVSASVGGYTSNVVGGVTFTAGSASTVTVGAAPATISTGGSSTITAYVTDSAGNPVLGETVTFSISTIATGTPTLGSTTAVTSVNGLAIISYKAGATAGTDKITATTGNAKTGIVSIVSSGNAIVVGGITPSTGAASIPADGVSTTVVRAKVTDINGAAAANIPVTFTTSAGSLTAASGVTDSTGVAQVTLTSTVNLGTANITENASGFAATTSVAFTAGSASSVALTSTLASLTSGATTTLTAVVKDAQNNPVTNETVAFIFAPNPASSVPSGTNVTGGTLASATAQTSANGVATVVYTGGATPGIDTIQAKLVSGTLSSPVNITVIGGTAVSSLTLSATPTTVKSDNSISTTVTVTALSAANALIPNVVVNLSAVSGVISTQSVTTGANGLATFTFSSGTIDKSNRTATITAVSGGKSGILPVQVVGTTLTANPNSGISLPNDGTSPATVTFTAKDAGGNPIPNTAITITQTGGTGAVTITPVTSPAGSTDANGQYVVTVAGTATVGAVTLTGTAAGTTATVGATVTSAAATFSINGLTKNGTALTSGATNGFSVTSMQTGDSLVVTVAAPAPTTSVTFATTMGMWTGWTVASGVITVPVAAGTASATLTTAAAGLANVQVFDPVTPTISDTLAVSMTATTPYAITLQASPSVVPKSVGSTTGTSTLIATVTDVNGLPVGGAPVVFSILNPTGGGESVSPVVVYTASVGTASLSLGQALTNFASGSLSSGQQGVQIRAQVLGAGGACPGVACVATEANNPTLNVSPSGNDAAIVIGGSAGSVAFAQATSLTDQGAASPIYVWPMSVMVADSNGNPAPQGTVVNLSLWPIAWSTGIICTIDRDGQVWNGTAWAAGNGGTFYNEDINENLFLDNLEDGRRYYYATGLNPLGTGTKDGALTPPNSAAGTLPATVTTDANGVANFNLTYPKTSALWIVDRIRAKTVVQGSDAVGEIRLRLPASAADYTPPSGTPPSGGHCYLPDSAFNF